MNESNQMLVQRILDVFNNPAGDVAYLKSVDFEKDLLKLNSKVRMIFETEPRVAFLQSPAYVSGDIHGNLEDLHFFSDNVWRLGMSLTAGNFVFLGDYVDRGMSWLECIAYLFDMKLLMPQKVFLLRGNHETRDVNGGFSVCMHCSLRHDSKYAWRRMHSYPSQLCVFFSLCWLRI